jgi:hypothetical protein
MGCPEQETWGWEMNENEINDGDSYYLLETTEGFVKIKNPTYYIAKYSYEDLQAAVLAEREACAQLVEEVGKQTAAAIRGRGEK